MSGTTGALGGEGSRLPDGVKASMETRVETVTAWPEIRPRTASFRNLSQMDFQGQSMRQLEQHDYSFDWSGAESLNSSCPTPPAKTLQDKE